MASHDVTGVPTVGPRRPTGHIAPALPVALALALAVAAVHPVAAVADDRSAQEAAIRAASRGASPPAGGPVNPVPEHDPGSPGAALAAVVSALDSLGPGRGSRGHLPPASRARVATAARHTRAALGAYRAAEPDLVRFFDHVAAALNHLDQVREPRGRRFQAHLDRLQRGLAGAARRVAADVVGTAVAGGARPSVVAAAREAMARGDDSMVALAYVVAVGAYADAFTTAAGGVVLDLALLEANLVGAVEGEAVGYAYAIGRDGVLHASGAAGQARRPADPDETDQSPTKEMYVASISKTISAVGLLRTLHAGGISVDEPIGAFLPPDWTLGNDLDQVTFRRLLNHTSGLDPADAAGGGSDPQSYASLQAYVAQGSDPAFRVTSNYRNANFSLMRVLLPRIAYGAVVDFFANTFGPEATHAGLYELYISDHVLGPAGISQDQCQPSESATTRTLLYLFPPGGSNGTDPGDWSLSCGATGWFLSAEDLGSFLAHLRFTGDLIGPATRALMDAGFLGWLNPQEFGPWIEGTWGTYRGHQGDYDLGMTGCVMNFPSAANAEFPGVKVQVTLLVNSVGGTLGGDLPIEGPRRTCKVVKEAYDSAWVGG